MAPTIPETCSIPEFAALLHVRERTVREWVERRKVESHRIMGGKVRIPRAEAARLYQESRRPAVRNGGAR